MDLTATGSLASPTPAALPMVSLTVLAALALSCGVSSGEVGARAPELTADEWLNVGGAAPPSIASLRDEPVAIEFFAHWCPHCQAAAPDVTALHELHAADGLRVIGFHAPTVDSRDGLEQFLEDEGYVFPVALEAGGETFERYHVTGIPTLILIDREGIVRWRGHPSDPELQSALAEVL